MDFAWLFGHGNGSTARKSSTNEALARVGLPPTVLGFTVLFLSCAAVGGCGRAPAEPDPNPRDPSTLKPFVDDSPTWSYDGQWIAFHRAFVSSYGPPGIYVVRKLGGEPRLVTPGDFSGPRYLRFSPDGQWLVGMWGLQLVLVRVTTGEVIQPFYTDNGATHPDWSPDGTHIVYARLFLSGFPPEDPESTGIHILNVATGEDRAVRSNGEVVYGTFPRWSRAGDRIGFISYAPGGLQRTVEVISPDGGSHKVLTSEEHVDYHDGQWLEDEISGRSGFVYRVSGPRPPPSYFVHGDGSGRIRLPYNLSPWDSFSHNGRELVLAQADPIDSLGVLFIAQADDISGSSRIQITSWSPPAAARTGSIARPQ